MAEQRSAFRIRLPWRQAAPAPRQSTATQPPTRPSTATPQSRATPGSQAASQPTTTSGTPDPLASPAPENQNSNQATTAPSAAAAQRPPFKPAGIAPVVGSSSPTQASRTEPKPSSPSRTGTQSQVSQPPTPSRLATQSQPITPSSSPSHKAHQSPSRLASHTAGERSSTSPSGTTAKMQPTPEEIPQSSSPSKKLEGQSLPSSKPIDKESRGPPKTQPQHVEHQPKQENTSETINEAKVQLPEMTIQPSIQSETATPASDLTEGRETPAPSQKSDITTNNQESKPSMDSNLEEAKEVIQDTGEKDHNEAKQEVKEILTTKEQPAVAFQPEKEQKDKQEQSSKKQTLKTSNSNGQQTKSITSHLRNKTTVTDSHQKLAMSNEQLPLHKDIKDSSISKLVQNTAVEGKNQSMEERPVNVITLAGDNRGASMQLGFDSSKKERPVHIHRGYKSNPDESVEATTDAEGSSVGRKSEDRKTIRDQEVEAYVNCNIQGINNSILLNSSITKRNPGVNLEIPRSPTEPVKLNDKTGSIVTRKAEFNTTPAQKLTYEPTIRRRCLRGLFLESSDSNPDNPKKPRRHGCRVDCKEKHIENEVDINLSR